MLIKANYQSPLGPITLLSDQANLLGLWFIGQKSYGAQFDLSNIIDGQTLIIKKTTHWLDDYFAGNNPNPTDIPIHLQTTKFRQRVLNSIKSVPTGKVVTYQDVANSLHQPHAVRAVGSAIGHNPISIIIPCHRIVGKNNKLTGYAGGIERKVKLLELEQVDLNSFIP